MNKTYGPYSPVRRVGDWYYVSGQVGIDPHTGSASADVHQQTRQVLENLNRLLDQHRLQPIDVVKTTVFLRNIEDFAACNDIYVEFFPEPRPARSCVAVASLPRIGTEELLVEIEAVAYKSGAA
ncbi:MAG TPA: RidA family protein [Candidatus Limnocylindrales bacterium]|nr:RidA family protein [Candidatus Limnocylindrales bacterium]